MAEKWKDLRIVFDGNKLRACWETEGARFHVWISDTGVPEGVIYKNATPPHCFDTRKLDAWAKTNAPVMAAVRELIVEAGLERAKQAYAEQEKRVAAVETALLASKVRIAIKAAAGALAADSNGIATDSPLALRKLATELSDKDLLVLRAAILRA